MNRYFAADYLEFLWIIRFIWVEKFCQLFVGFKRFRAYHIFGREFNNSGLNLKNVCIMKRILQRISTISLFKFHCGCSNTFNVVYIKF